MDKDKINKTVITAKKITGFFVFLRSKSRSFATMIISDDSPVKSAEINNKLTNIANI